MVKRVFTFLESAPMFWVAVGLGLLVFSFNRILPGLNWETYASEQSVLDRAFIERLHTFGWKYQVLEDTPQTFGAHVLPQYLRALVSVSTGDSGRAGIWLSLAGITATLCGLYPLSQRIFPMRGFGLITLLCAGALGAVQFSLSPDFSSALGMALVVWGMVFFLTAITRRNPYDVFVSGFLFGLAGYIRIELSIIWFFLAFYLTALSLFQSKEHKAGFSYIPLALGGLFTLLLVLWPLLNRNMQLARSPILPGFDSEVILGAETAGGGSASEALGIRLLDGLKLLLFNFRGLGIFAGILWPVGMGLCLLTGRHKHLPYFWLPILTAMLLGLSLLSYVTGFDSFRESLLILSPLILPFALLPAAYGIHQWMQTEFHDEDGCRRTWILCGLILYLMIQLPHFLRLGTSGNRDLEKSRLTLVEEFSRLAPDRISPLILSDMPGSFLTAGKFNVIGMQGETDWEILTSKYSNGEFKTTELLNYMREKGILMIHLSDPDLRLVSNLRALPDAPEITRMDGFSPPHQVFRVDWL